MENRFATLCERIDADVGARGEVRRGERDALGAALGDFRHALKSA